MDNILPFELPFDLNAVQKFLVENLPDSVLRQLPAHTRTYYTIYKYTLIVKNLFLSIFTPLISRIIEAPDVASVLLLIVFLWVSLQAVRMMKRAVMFWVRMTLRATLWAVVVGVVGWVWSRGVDDAVADLQRWGHVWWGEYERWQSYQGDGKTGKTRGR